jgi:serine/threonine protein kinase
MSDRYKLLTGCPSREQLWAFHQNQLIEPDHSEVADHAVGCPSCQLILSEFSPRPDSAAPPDPSLARESSRQPAPKPLPPPTIHAGQADSPAGDAAAAATFIGLGQLGHYELTGVLGRGGMATVYRAKHINLKKPVAIKILPSRVAHDPAAVARFQREMEAVGQLDHPNIVRATDAGQIDDAYYLVMELVEGEDLGKLVARLGRVPIPEACELIRQAAVGLQHAHEHGLVHRDIKPSNLMLTPQGRIKILDMGLARLRGRQHADGELTATGAVMGTADYMAPEQGTDTHSVDIRADLYSLGCTLYQLLAGQPPFAGSEFNTPIKKIRAHARAPIPSIRDAVPGAPDALVEVLTRLMAKWPGQRYATPGELARALKPLCVGCDLKKLGTAQAANTSTTDSRLPLTDVDCAAITLASVEIEPESKAQPAIPPASPPRRRPVPLGIVLAVVAVVAALVIGLALSWF